MPDPVELKVSVVTEGQSKLDQLVQSVQSIEAAITKAGEPVEHFKRTIHEGGEESGRFSEALEHLGESLREHVYTPFGSASLAVGKFVESLGVAGITVAAGIGGLIAFGDAALSSMEKIGAMATQINNLSVITGLSTKQVGEFTFAAKAAGSDIGSFEMAMRMLSRGLSDGGDEGKRTSAEFKKLGIETRDMLGNVRPTQDLFLAIGDALNNADSASARSTIGLNLLGRAGTELIPTLMKLRENLDLAKDAGVGDMSAATAELEHYHTQVLQLETAWSKVTSAIEEAMARTGSLIAIGLGVIPDDVMARADKMRRKQQGLDQEPERPLDVNAIRNYVGNTLVHPTGAIHLNPAGAGPSPDSNATADAMRLNGEMKDVQTKLSALYSKAGSSDYGLLDKKDAADEEDLEKRKKGIQEQMDDLNPFSERSMTKRTAGFNKGILDSLNAATPEADRLKKSLEEVNKEIEKIRESANASPLGLTDQASYRALEGQKATIVARIKALEDAKEAAKSHEEYMLQLGNKNANPVEKAFNDLADRKKKLPGLSAADFAEESVGTSVVVGQEFAKLDAKSQRENEAQAKINLERDDYTYKHQREGGGGLSFAIGSSEKDTYGETPEQQFKRKNEESVRAILGTASGTAGMDPKDFLSMNESIASIQAGTEREGLQRQASKAEQESQLSIPLGSGARGQEQAINEAYQIRLGLAGKLQDVELDRASKEEKASKALVDTERAKADFIKESQDAQLERQMKMLELAQKQKEEARSLSGSVFDAFFDKNPGKAMSDVFLGQVKDIGKSVFSNITQSAGLPIAGAIDGLKSIGAGGEKKTPAIIATEKNTEALDNVRKTYEAIATGSALPSGASTPGLSSALNSIPGFKTLSSSINSSVSSLTKGSVGSPALNALFKPFAIGGGGGTVGGGSGSVSLGGSAPAGYDEAAAESGGYSAAPSSYVGDDADGGDGSLSIPYFAGPGGGGTAAAGTGGVFPASYFGSFGGGGGSGPMGIAATGVAGTVVSDGGTSTAPAGYDEAAAAESGGWSVAPGSAGGGGSIGGGGSSGSDGGGPGGSTAGSQGGSSAMAPLGIVATAGAKIATTVNDLSTSLTKMSPYLAAFGAGATSVTRGGGIQTLLHGSSVPGPSNLPMGEANTDMGTMDDGMPLDTGTTQLSRGQAASLPSTSAQVLSQVGAGVALAATAYVGVSTAIKDFSRGGAQGVIGGIGAVAGTAAAFDPEPVSAAILGSVAMVSKIVTSIMGDPRANREASIQHELTNNAYNSTGYIDQRGNFVPGAAPKAISYFGSSGGASYDTNFQGGIRGGSFASTTRNTYDPSGAANQLRNGYISPSAGTPDDEALGYGDQSGTGPTQSPTVRNGQITAKALQQRMLQPMQAPALVIQVSAMDSKSFLDHASDISAAVRKGIQMGHPVVQEIQQAVNPR